MDTIAMRGPASRLLLEALQHEHQVQRADHETGEFREYGRYYGRYEVGRALAEVKGDRLDRGWSVRIEVSLPTMLRGVNRDPVAADDLIELVDSTLFLLREHGLPDLPTVDRLQVHRLDVVRDFHGLASPVDTLRSLSPRVVSHARHQVDRRRPDGPVQQLERGSLSRYVARLYYKGYQLLDAAKAASDSEVSACLEAWAIESRQQLRYEVELRRPVLREKRLTKLTDCTAERLEQVGRHYFDATGWSLPYGGTRVHDKLRDLQAELTPRLWNDILAVIGASHCGVEARLSRHRREAVLPIVRKHRLFDNDDNLVTRRLEYDAGDEVAQ